MAPAGRLFSATFAVAMVWITSAAAQSPITADQVLRTKPFAGHLESILNGEIVSVGLPLMESGDELDVAMALLVPAALEKTVVRLQQLSEAPDGLGVRILADRNIPIDAPPSRLDALFGKVAFDASEANEVHMLMDIGPGGRYNFSADEIAMIRDRAQALRSSGANAADARRAMSRAMGEVLKRRYLAYKENGLTGLPPYQVGPSQQIEPAQELIRATESMGLLKKQARAYFDCLRFYPQRCSTGLTHRFFWTKQEQDHRPLFVLKHWISDIQSDYALITERRYYLSHSLNSLQVTIGCLPYRQGTLVVLFNQTFTDKVDVAIGKSIVKTIGRMEVEKNSRPIFEGLRKAFPR